MSRVIKPGRKLKIIKKDYQIALSKFTTCVTVCTSKLKRLMDLKKEIAETASVTLAPEFNMQNTIQKMQDTIQMMNTIQKTVQDTALAIIRKIDEGGTDTTASDEGQGDAQAIIRKI